MFLTYKDKIEEYEYKLPCTFYDMLGSECKYCPYHYVADKGRRHCLQDYRFMGIK